MANERGCGLFFVFSGRVRMSRVFLCTRWELGEMFCYREVYRVAISRGGNYTSANVKYKLNLRLFLFCACNSRKQHL